MRAARAAALGDGAAVDCTLPELVVAGTSEVGPFAAYTVGLLPVDTVVL